ncbi:hypothetical protein MKW92_016205, partial [Papaver armeniacum]
IHCYHAPRFATSSSIAAKAPAVKFSNHTERLQRINSIRKAPIGAQMKRVIAILYETKEAFTADQIYEACYVDVINNRDVFYGLAKNWNVFYDGMRFSYKGTYLPFLTQTRTSFPAHDIKNKTELLCYIRKFPEGKSIIDVKDAYPVAMEDFQVLLLCYVAYPTNPKIAITDDDELKQLIQGIELSPDMTGKAIAGADCQKFKFHPRI